jgi:hypothetical protein
VINVNYFCRVTTTILAGHGRVGSLVDEGFVDDVERGAVS